MFKAALLILTMAAACGGPALAADEIGAITLPSKAGTKFESFTWWDKVQLGATTLVNPRTAEKAMVFYAYDPKALSTLGNAGELTTELTIAKELPGGTYETIPPDEVARAISALKRGENVPTGYKILTTKRIGGTPGQALISWPGDQPTDKPATE